MAGGCLDRIQLASCDHSVLDMNKGLNLGCSQTSSVHNVMAAAEPGKDFYQKINLGDAKIISKHLHIWPCLRSLH